MGLRGPYVPEREKQRRATQLRKLLADQAKGKLPAGQAALCAAMGFSAPTVRRIAREAGINLRGG